MTLNDILKNNFNSIYGFQLSGQQACNDVIFYYRFSTSVNYWEDFDINLQSYHIRAFVVGFESTVSIYDIDLNAVRIELQSQIEKEKSASSGYFKSFYNSFYAATIGTSSTSSAANHEDPNNPNSRVKTWNTRGGKMLFPLNPSLQFFDAKRRIIRLSIDPFHTLIATADALGRVELYDINSDCFIRIWKGVRDAYLGWHVDEEDTTQLFAGNGNNNRNSAAAGQFQIQSGMAFNETQMSEVAKSALQLIIYAPLLGLISIYKMRNGPCLRVIPVGMNCKVVSISSSFIQLNQSIQTVYPVACDAETKLFTFVSLNSKFQTETELSYLVDLMDALDLDPMQDGTGMLTRSDSNQFESPQNPLRNNETDFGVRHSDMRASVREAIERGRRIKQPDHFVNNEINKYLYLISGKLASSAGSSSSAAHKMNLNDLEKLEKKILGLVHQQKTLQSLFQTLQIIENFELNGFDIESLVTSANANPVNASNSSNPSPRNTTIKPFGGIAIGGTAGVGIAQNNNANTAANLPWIRINTHNKRKFSLNFHKEINEILKEKLSLEETTNQLKTNNPILYRRISDEIDIRTKLLDAYKHLGDPEHANTDPNQRSSTATSSSASNYNLSLSTLKEDASHACKANHFRSESLCWVLRAIKRIEHKQKVMAGTMKSPGIGGVGGIEKDTSRYSLSPKPPGNNGNKRHTCGCAGNHNSSLSLGNASNNLTSGNNSLYDSPVRHSSFTNSVNGSGNRRASFCLTPTNSSVVTSDITLKKLIENNTRNSFTSPTIDVLVSPSSQYNNSPMNNNGGGLLSQGLFKSPNLSTSSSNGIPSSSNSSASIALEAASLNFSIFRALHILDESHDLYLILNLIRSWLESEKGNLSLDTYLECQKNNLSIYNYFQSSVAIKSQNFTEILSMIKFYQSNPPSSPLNPLVSSSPPSSTGFMKPPGFSLPSNPLNIPASSGMDQYYYHLHPNILYPLLGLIFKSLIIGDLSSLHSFYNAMKYESSAFSGIEGLRDFLPCFLEYISKQSLVILVQDLLGRNISTSPIQRLLRDHLLTFQDLLSRYKQFKTRQLKKQEQKQVPPKTNDEDNKDDQSKEVEEDEDDGGLETNELRLMDQLRLDVLNEFSTQEISEQDIDLHSHIPSFDEFVR